MGPSGTADEAGASLFVSYIFPDFNAVRFLKRDFDALIDKGLASYSAIEVKGCEIYLVKQWILERKIGTIITSFTGNNSHMVQAIKLTVFKNESYWPMKFKKYLNELIKFQHAKLKAFHDEGYLFVTNLLSFYTNTDLSIRQIDPVYIRDGEIPVPQHYTQFEANFNLKRLDCGGRSALLFSNPPKALEDKFFSMYKVNEGISIVYAVKELVLIVQIALYYFDTINPTYCDGILCNKTQQAIEKWWNSIGKTFFGPIPQDGILGPKTVAAILSVLLSCKFRLNLITSESSKDPFDIISFKLSVYQFQKNACKMKDPSWLLDGPTFAKLVSITDEKLNYDNILKFKKVVNKTVNDISGRRNNKISNTCVETTNIEELKLNVTGKRLEYLFFGKGRPTTLTNVLLDIYYSQKKYVSKPETRLFEHLGSEIGGSTVVPAAANHIMLDVRSPTDISHKASFKQTGITLFDSIGSPESLGSPRGTGSNYMSMFKNVANQRKQKFSDGTSPNQAPNQSQALKVPASATGPRDNNTKLSINTSSMATSNNSDPQLLVANNIPASPSYYAVSKVNLPTLPQSQDGNQGSEQQQQIAHLQHQTPKQQITQQPDCHHHHNSSQHHHNSSQHHHNSSQHHHNHHHHHHHRHHYTPRSAKTGEEGYISNNPLKSGVGKIKNLHSRTKSIPLKILSNKNEDDLVDEKIASDINNNIIDSSMNMTPQNPPTPLSPDNFGFETPIQEQLIPSRNGLISKSLKDSSYRGGDLSNSEDNGFYTQDREGYVNSNASMEGMVDKASTGEGKGKDQEALFNTEFQKRLNRRASCPLVADDLNLKTLGYDYEPIVELIAKKADVSRIIQKDPVQRPRRNSFSQVEELLLPWTVSFETPIDCVSRRYIQAKVNSLATILKVKMVGHSDSFPPDIPDIGMSTGPSAHPTRLPDSSSSSFSQFTLDSTPNLSMAVSSALQSVNFAQFITFLQQAESSMVHRLEYLMKNLHQIFQFRKIYDSKVSEVDTLKSKLKYEVRILKIRVRDVDDSATELSSKIESLKELGHVPREEVASALGEKMVVEVDKNQRREKQNKNDQAL